MSLHREAVVIRRTWKQFAIVVGALLSGLLCMPYPSAAQTIAQQQAEYAGTLGQTKIGLTVVMTGDKVSRAHYFYYRYLKDIPLSGAKSGNTLTLPEAHGTFALHFVAGGTSDGKPLDFSSSTGLEGTWNDGNKTLPVKLEGGGGPSVAEPDHWYAQITDETDEVFENRVQGFYFAALKDDPAEAAKFVAFPLKVNWSETHHELVKSPAQLAQQWKRIFTPAYVAALRAEAPHDMPIIKSEYAMLGSGLAFFTDKGVGVLNVMKQTP